MCMSVVKLDSCRHFCSRGRVFQRRPRYLACLLTSATAIKCLIIATRRRTSVCDTMDMATQMVTCSEECVNHMSKSVHEECPHTALLMSATAVKFGVGLLPNFFGHAFARHSSTVILANSLLSMMVNCRAISRGSTSRNFIFFMLRGTMGGGVSPPLIEAVIRLGAPVARCGNWL